MPVENNPFFNFIFSDQESSPSGQKVVDPVNASMSQ